MSVDIVVRFSDETAAALKAERTRTGCSVSEFIRRAVTDALNPTGYEVHLRAAEERGEMVKHP